MRDGKQSSANLTLRTKEKGANHAQMLEWPCHESDGLMVAVQSGTLLRALFCVNSKFAFIYDFFFVIPYIKRNFVGRGSRSSFFCTYGTVK